MSQTVLLLKKQLCHPLYSASNAMQRIYKKILDPLEITYPQYLIMLTLWEKDGINIQAIIEATFLDSGTITPLLKKLSAKKLIETRTMREDRRNKLVYLTAKGQRLRAKAETVPETLSSLLPFQGERFLGFKQQVEELYQVLLSHEERL